MNTNQWPSDWMRGILALCVLKVLTAGPTYGYAIAAALEKAGLGTVKGGTLYPLLTRLESSGLVTTEWKAGDGGPGRKYFQLTDEGRNELSREHMRWEHFSSTVLTHLSQSPPDKEKQQ